MMSYHGKSYPDDVKCIHLHHAIIVNVVNNLQIIPCVYHLIICLQGLNWTSELLAPRPDCNMSGCIRPARSSNTSPGHTALWCAHCTQPATTSGRGVYTCQLFIKFAGELKDIFFRDEHDPLSGFLISRMDYVQEEAEAAPRCGCHYYANSDTGDIWDGKQILWNVGQGRDSVHSLSNFIIYFHTFQLLPTSTINT